MTTNKSMERFNKNIKNRYYLSTASFQNKTEH